MVIFAGLCARMFESIEMRMALTKKYTQDCYLCSDILILILRDEIYKPFQNSCSIRLGLIYSELN